jgi:hypothetical protein
MNGFSRWQAAERYDMTTLLHPAVSVEVGARLRRHDGQARTPDPDTRLRAAYLDAAEEAQRLMQMYPPGHRHYARLAPVVADLLRLARWDAMEAAARRDAEVQR